MFNIRLIQLMGRAKIYIAKAVAFQWLSLLCNITVTFCVAAMLDQVYRGDILPQAALTAMVICGAAILLLWFFTQQSAKMSHHASKEVKGTLRGSIYQKLLSLGSRYHQSISTSQAVMLAGEGVEQLDIYFSRFLPQLFYSLLAPLTLFAVLSFIHLPSAFLLLVCVPLIPLSLMAVQTFAKKLLHKYWGEYTALGDSFLENLQGLTTLKIYQADAQKNQEMNQQAERFRKITMKVLTMQLNSVTIMDIAAYGGTALGIITAINALQAGRIGIFESMIIMMLAAEFFIPLRLLGSYFHIAMNGTASADKIFHLLDTEQPRNGTTECTSASIGITFENVSFSYIPGQATLSSVSASFPAGSFTSIVGESGCGKSTIAKLVTRSHSCQDGKVCIDSIPIEDITEQSLMRNVALISHNSVLFKGSVRENLRMGNPDAPDSTLWATLAKVHLKEFALNHQGLDTMLDENASNLSGGQRQRLAMARALLHDAAVYIFDEATSNIDVESENHIMTFIHTLAKHKTVILISHRLANVVQSDNIYMMAHGSIIASGTHQVLLSQRGEYAKIYTCQQELEQYSGGYHETNVF